MVELTSNGQIRGVQKKTDISYVGDGFSFNLDDRKCNVFLEKWAMASKFGAELTL